MGRLIAGYIIILVGIAGLVLPIIPGLVLLVIGLNLVSEEGGKKLLEEMKVRRPFSWFLAKVEI